MKPTIRNPIIEEIHRFRAEHAKRFNYDVRAVAEDARRRQWDSGAKVVGWDKRRKRMVEIKKPAWLSSKLVWLREKLETIVAEGDKTLVFSQYTDERFAGADWLEKELADYGTLNYSKATSDGKRKAMLADFKEKSEHKVFVGHPKTAGLGLNELVVANYVIHFDDRSPRGGAGRDDGFDFRRRVHRA